MLILFINSISVYNSAGNITLMCRRAESMKKLGISTKFINTVNKMIDQTYPDYPYDIEILNTNPTDRFASIHKYIEEMNPQYICFHGNRANTLVDRLYGYCKSHNIKIMADVQGALEEMTEYFKGNLIKKGLVEARFLLSKYYLKKLLNKCDAVFVVSDELENYCKKTSANPYKILKIHCGITDVLKASCISNWRKEIREELKLDDNAIVFCYSGILNSWGNFEETLENWKKYDAAYDNMFFLLLSKPDDVTLKKLNTFFPKHNYIVEYLNHDDYYKYLSACDVSFLIREDTVTNRVAFPNKFSEYLNCGNMCCISSVLKNPVKILDDCNIPYIKDDADFETAIKLINYRTSHMEDYYILTREVCREYLLYDSQLGHLDYFKDCK